MSGLSRTVKEQGDGRGDSEFIELRTRPSDELEITPKQLKVQEIIIGLRRVGDMYMNKYPALSSTATTWDKFCNFFSTWRHGNQRQAIALQYLEEGNYNLKNVLLQVKDILEPIKDKDIGELMVGVISVLKQNKLVNKAYGNQLEDIVQMQLYSDGATAIAFKVSHFIRVIETVLSKLDQEEQQQPSVK